jgi:hypothetical protein
MVLGAMLRSRVLNQRYSTRSNQYIATQMYEVLFIKMATKDIGYKAIGSKKCENFTVIGLILMFSLWILIWTSF